jgi:hypothetical protein
MKLWPGAILGKYLKPANSEADKYYEELQERLIKDSLKSMPDLVDELKAIMSSRERVKPEEPSKESKKKEAATRGGIDLTPANMNLQTRNGGLGIKFHLDPAMFAKLQNAPGFVPVIINIQPMNNLLQFLGLEDEPSTQTAA